MSTWDDNPNDYKSAVSMTGRLQSENARLHGQLQATETVVALYRDENARLKAEIDQQAKVYWQQVAEIERLKEQLKAGCRGP